MKRRTDLAEVAGVDDDLDVAIESRDFPEPFDRTIARRVVDENVLVSVAPQSLEDLLHPGVHLEDVFFLVEARRNDTDQMHAVSRLDRSGRDYTPGVVDLSQEQLRPESRSKPDPTLPEAEDVDKTGTRC